MENSTMLPVHLNDAISAACNRVNQRGVSELHQLMNWTGTAQLGVIDMGKINSMCIPMNWTASEEYGHDPDVQVFHPQSSPDCQLVVFCRDEKITEQSALRFSRLLAKPSHQLSSDVLPLLGEVIRDKASKTAFVLTRAATENINGKQVLTVEGFYPESAITVKHMFFEAEKTGTLMQEILFQAPSSKFREHFNGAKQAINSINWKIEQLWHEPLLEN
ncbi:MAG: hypothetical protein K2X81_00685 [Candidatus Obscuribacterales bacterium]|nr:hypothetical protein [Candidatus Obscuribacterales bacterium]